MSTATPLSAAVTTSTTIRSRRRYRRSDVLWAYLLIAPNMIGLAVFFLWPIIQNVYFSFTSWDMFGTYHWTGWSNYSTLLSDPDVRNAVRNTLIYAGLTVPLSIALATVIAVLLNQRIRGLSWFRLLYFLPTVTMPAAIAMVWRWLFNDNYGLINAVLRALSLPAPTWLAGNLSLFSLVAVGIWMAIGYDVIILLGGLQSIPRTYYEAAALDGAGPLQVFVHITLPILTPTTFFLGVISVIQGLQMFDLVYLMIGSSSAAIPNTETLVYLFYRQAFEMGNKGYAAAIAVLLFGIVLIFTALQFWLQRRWVHYE